ncbi:hypothetical protein BGZ95_005977, partial [Linnemannia exigua]
HQTGRLRIVRRVPRPPQDTPRDPAVNAAGATTVAAAAEQPSTSPYQVTPSSTSAASSDSQDNTYAGSSSVSGKQVDKHDSGLQTSDENGRSDKLDPTLAPTPGRDAGAISSTAATTMGSRASASGNIDTQNTNATADQAPPVTLPQHQRGTTWRLVEHGILTFIASLIPAPPPENEQLEPNAVPVAERAL